MLSNAIQRIVSCPTPRWCPGVWNRFEALIQTVVTQAGTTKQHITDVSHGGEEGKGTPGGPHLWTLFFALPPDCITLATDGCEEAAALGAATLAAHRLQPEAVESALPGWHPPPDVLPNGVYVLHPNGKTSNLHRALDPLAPGDGFGGGAGGAAVGRRSHTLRFPRSSSEQRVQIMEGDAEVPITQRCVAELVLEPDIRHSTSWMAKPRQDRAVSVWLSADGLLGADVGEEEEEGEQEEAASGGGIGKSLLLILLMSFVASLMARLVSGGPMLQEQPSGPPEASSTGG